MRVKLNTRAVAKILVLSLLSVGVVGGLAQKLSPCRDACRGNALVEWVDQGLDWAVDASSRFSASAILGNSWAPGQVTWHTSREPREAQPSPLAQAWRSVQLESAAWDEDYSDCLRLTPVAVAAEVEIERPSLIVLAETEVVVVTAKMPRLEPQLESLTGALETLDSTLGLPLVHSLKCRKYLRIRSTS